MNTFRTLIIPTTHVELARTIAATLSPSDGTGMWATPLAPTVDGIPTHYISTGLIATEFAAICPCTQWVQDEQGNWVSTDTIPGSPQLVYEQCMQYNLAVTLQEIEDLFVVADVSDQDPFVAMQRLNLTLCRVSEETM